MPQMKPLNWLYLFVSFSIIMMINCMMNFYIKNTKINLYYLNNNNKNSKFNWKW